MFSLICVWINGWVNNREAGDLRRHRGHYDVNVMTGLLSHNNALLIVQPFTTTCRTIMEDLYTTSWRSGVLNITIDLPHHSDVIMSAMASKFIQPLVQAHIKENIKALRWTLWGEFNRWPVNSPHKGPVTRKLFPFDGVIMHNPICSCDHPWFLRQIASWFCYFPLVVYRLFVTWP